ncbi:HOASN domain-containing protein [Lysobacter enzymogenes]|uniref:HOASN domain-containing protein n=1 Tax=Lysobacter enzymogenes TaxID=69 RepID=UPI00384C6760
MNAVMNATMPATAANASNHSLQQLDALQSNRARILARALDPEAPFAHLHTASKTLSSLAEDALKGERAANDEYQKLLYILSLSDDTGTALTRRWLSNEAYRVEERHIPAADVPEPLSEAEFLARIEQEVASRSREKHPMSEYIFEGRASRAQLQVFLRRQWFRTFRLYRDAADLLVNLVDVDEAAALGRYLYGELGEEDEQGSHPRLLAKLLKAIDLDADFQAVSDLPEEIAYLNNRVRSFRNPDVGWGLAVFYITEIVVPGNHEKLYKALLKAGLSEDEAEYYRIHVSLVPPRAKREWSLIARRLPDHGFQKSFLTSLAQHFRVERAYYDAVWEEMQRVP